MKYLWIGAVVLACGLRLWLRSMQHKERQDYEHYVEDQQRQAQRRAEERIRQYSKANTTEGTDGVATAVESDEALFASSADTFYRGLVERHYLQYADPADTSTIHQAFVNTTNTDDVLPMAYAEDHTMLCDGRYYPCNGGLVYMEGGYIKLIAQLRPTFRKMNFKCEASDQQRTWSPEHRWTNETIVINGKTYTTLTNFTGTGYKEAPARFAEIMNEELERQGFRERIYLVSSGKKGKLAILTPQLYEYIDGHSVNDFHSPQTVADWRELQEL
jgi:hypothetical protein